MFTFRKYRINVALLLIISLIIRSSWNLWLIRYNGNQYKKIFFIVGPPLSLDHIMRRWIWGWKKITPWSHFLLEINDKNVETERRKNINMLSLDGTLIPRRERPRPLSFVNSSWSSIYDAVWKCSALDRHMQMWCSYKGKDQHYFF